MMTKTGACRVPHAATRNPCKQKHKPRRSRQHHPRFDNIFNDGTTLLLQVAVELQCTHVLRAPHRLAHTHNIRCNSHMFQSTVVEIPAEQGNLERAPSLHFCIWYLKRNEGRRTTQLAHRYVQVTSIFHAGASHSWVI